MCVAPRIGSYRESLADLYLYIVPGTDSSGKEPTEKSASQKKRVLDDDDLTHEDLDNISAGKRSSGSYPAGMSTLMLISIYILS